jgi:DNA-directed RNA polymerase specialized sigma24 family protein
LREIDRAAAQAAGDPAALDGFVRKYESFILKCASNTSKRYITKSDDEWSVAMEAFCSAIASYSYEKGSFLSFAELLIRRRLIDYFRLEQRRLAEFPVHPAAFTGEGEDAPGEAPNSDRGGERAAGRIRLLLFRSGRLFPEIPENQGRLPPGREIHGLLPAFMRGNAPDQGPSLKNSRKKYGRTSESTGAAS